MSNGDGAFRRVVWSEIFPGIMLVKCVRLALSLPVLTLALVGTLLMPLGPRAIGLGNPEAKVGVAVSPGTLGGSHLPPWLKTELTRHYGVLLQPFYRVLDRHATLGEQLRHVGISLWYLLIWSVCGGAITRVAVVQLGKQEQVSLTQLRGHMRRNWLWYLTSPLFPLIGLLLLSLPLLVVGWLMHLDLGVLVAGLLWPVVLLIGLLMGILFTGLVFGWPLMWPTISTEEAGDSFQAFSNSYSFTFQRPLHYLGYVVLAVVLGTLGVWLVEWFVAMVLMLSQWGVSFGLGHERLHQIFSGELDKGTLGRWGHGSIEFWQGLVRSLPAAYAYAFLFCSASAIYLLLRRHVDQTDFDKVSMPEQAGTFSLPALRPGPQGVPEVDPTSSTPPDGAGDS